MIIFRVLIQSSHPILDASHTEGIVHSYFYKFLFLIIYGLGLPLAVVLSVSRFSFAAAGALLVVLGSFLVFVSVTAGQTRCLEPVRWAEGRRSLLILLGFVIVSAVLSAGCGWFLNKQCGILLGGAVLVYAFAVGFFGAIGLSPLSFDSQNTFGYLVPGGYGACAVSIPGLSPFRDGWMVMQTLEQLAEVVIWSALCWAVFEIRLRRPITEPSRTTSIGKAVSLSFIDSGNK